MSGQVIGVAMVIVLAVACYLLARVGAGWALAAEDNEDAQS